MKAARHRRPAILAELPPDRHAVIEASAGTGKTFTLEHLVVDRLLRTDLSIGQILVVTFTEKAASEMRERIRRLIAKLLELKDGAGADLEPAESWTLDEGARNRLERALREFDTAPISTIHSFCQRILSEQAFANQRLFAETLVPSGELLEEVFYELLRTDFARGMEGELLRLWLEQRTVDELRSLLAEAVGFRGRIEPPVDGAEPRHILDAFPVEEAFAETLRQALRPLLHHSTLRALIPRYERFRAAILDFREGGAEQGEIGGWSLLWQLQRAGSGGKGDLPYMLGHLAKHQGKDPAVDRLLAPLQALGERIPSLEGLVVARFAPKLREAVARRKKQDGLLDFDDMLMALRDGLRGPNGEVLIRLLRERYRLALIDEFQDTDEVQWEIFRTLFFSGGTENRLVLIGDPKQAIYRFRGADVETYLRARKEVREARGVVAQLKHCYRATGALIEGYNHILDQGAEPPFFSGAIRYEPAVECGDPDLRFLEASGEAAHPIHLLRLDLREGGASRGRVLPVLAARIAEEIQRLTSEQGPRFGKAGAEEALSHRDIFILHRSAPEGRMVGDVLRRAGIPFSFVKAEGLFQSAEAAAWLDLLAAVARPEERSLRMRAWMSPFFEFPFDSLGAAMELSPTDPPWEQLRSWGEDADQRRYERLFARILDESGVLQREILTADDRSLTNLLHLSELLLERAATSRCTLDELVAWLKALVEGRERPPGEGGDQQRLDTEKEAVQIMTMHASKGLEAKVVFLVGGMHASPSKNQLTIFHKGGERIGWAGKPPDWVQERVRREGREEDERLLYVALTRAKARLYLPVYEVDDRRPKGAYAALNERLLRILQAGPPPGFVVEDLPVEAAASAGEDEALSLWSPSWQPGSEVAEEGARMERLRQERMGFEITSYTRLRGFRAANEIDRDEFTGEGVLVVQPEPDDLPGGAATGIFLHEVLARLPMEEVEADWEAFRINPRVHLVFEEEARRHGIPARHLEHAKHLVFAGLTRPVPLRDGGRMDGVIAATWILREMEFLYPYPEESHPPLGAPGPENGYIIERGFIKGFVDLIFEKDGVYYFADWKSDNLPGYSASILRRHVQKSYELQAQLYALALVKLLGIRSAEDHAARFGGLHYFFLRGMLAGGEAGVYFERPDWETLLAWEDALIRRGRS